MDPPVDQFQRLVHQVLWYAVMGILTIAVAFGAAYYVQAKANYRDCIERNANAVGTNRALSKLAEAMAGGGDKVEAQVLSDFLDQRQDLPECDRPPLTRQHTPGD